MTRGTALMIASAITRSSFIREINVRRRSALTRPIARKPSDERSCAGTTIVTKVARSISTSMACQTFACRKKACSLSWQTPYTTTWRTTSSSSTSKNERSFSSMMTPKPSSPTIRWTTDRSVFRLSPTSEPETNTISIVSVLRTTEYCSRCARRRTGFFVDIAPSVLPTSGFSRKRMRRKRGPGPAVKTASVASLAALSPPGERMLPAPPSSAAVRVPAPPPRLDLRLLRCAALSSCRL